MHGYRLQPSSAAVRLSRLDGHVFGVKSGRERMVVVHKNDGMISKSPSGECFTYTDDASMTDASPSLYKADGRLMLQTKAFEPPQNVALPVQRTNGLVGMSTISENLAVVTRGARSATGSRCTHSRVH